VLHEALAEIAPVLLHAPSALLKNETVQVMDDDNGDGDWHVGKEQRIFVYRYQYNDDARREVIFVENDKDAPVRVEVLVNSSKNVVVVEMKPYSSILMIDGVVRYDSGSIQPQSMSFTRHKIHGLAELFNWTTWNEPVGAMADDDETRRTHAGTRPLEQTTLNIMNATIWTDYAWYTTTFTLEEDEVDLPMLRVDTDKANGIVVFLNGSFVDAADNREHSEGNVTHYLSLGNQPLKRGTHVLSLLSESLGYHNLIGRWIRNTGAKRKGITGDVVLFSPSNVEYVGTTT